MHKTLENQLSIDILFTNPQWRAQFTEDQLLEIETGLNRGIDVSVYAKPSISHTDMALDRLTLQLEKKEKSLELFKNKWETPNT